MHAYISTIFCRPPDAPANAMKETTPDVAPGVATSDFFLYPNPASGNFSIERKGDRVFEHVSVEIYTMNGNRMMAAKMTGEQKHLFAASELPAGIYVVKVVADDYSETIKLIRTR
jgi:hypothetical protein